MCIDDYEFRHSSATRQKICRRFIFENEDGNKRVFLINISQFQMYGDLCLCQILIHLNRKGLNIKDHKFEFVDLNISVEAGDKCLVPFDVMNKKDVCIRMHKIEQLSQFDGQLPVDDSESMKDEKQQDDDWIESQSYEQVVKQKKKKQSITGKTKEPEKTIQQAIFKTKYWRYLHEKGSLSLKNSALKVGISKKTLDDYFLVLRIGQLHGYDFTKNLDKKMGHLRAFIKEQKVKIKGRLSKNVNCFVLVPEPDLNNLFPIKDWSKLQEISEQLQSLTFSDPKFSHYPL